MPTEQKTKPKTAITPAASKIWDEQGEESVQKDRSEALDITKFQGEAFKCEFVRKDEYEYQYDGDTRQGITYVGKLIATSATACEKQIGTLIGIYGKGLLNHQFSDLKMKAGDVFIVTCGPKEAIGGGKSAYQTQLKVTKRA